MSSYVTQSLDSFSDSVKANFSLDRLAILNGAPQAWRCFAASLEPALKGYQSSPMNYTSAEKSVFVALRDGLTEATETKEVVDLLDGLLTCTLQASGNSRRVRLRAATRHFLMQARWEGLVLLPAGCMRSGLVPWLAGTGGAVSWPSPPTPFFGELSRTVMRVAVDFGISEHDVATLRSYVDRLFACASFDSVASLGEDFYEAFWAFLHQTLLPNYDSSKTQSTAFSRMQGLFNKAFEFFYRHEGQSGREVDVPQFASGYWLQKRKNDASRVDGYFGWWIQEKPEFTEWANLFSWFVHSTPRKTPQYTVTCMKRLCSYLESLDAPPRSPNEVSRSHFVRREDSPRQTFLEFLEERGDSGRQIGYQSLLMVRSFFDRWHDEYGDKSQTWSNPIRDHDFDGTWNKGDLSQKTNKEILPVRLIKLMKQILTENDYAWPKTLKEDHIRWHSPKEGTYVDVWCPARAIGLLLLLTIPIRSLQMRLLDSGEGDEFIADPVTRGEWIRNDGPLAERGRQEGLVQQIYDGATRKHFLGLRISTNKTAVVTSAEFEIPYVIPWQCDELLPHIWFMRNWQAVYNPVNRKLTRRDLSDGGLRPSDAVKQLPGYYFLFADPANNKAARIEPVSYNRLRSFMLKVLEEAQRRMRADGEDVTLMGQEANGALSSPYSLHGLRASGITHFVEAGVPVQVIAEFLVGHAIILTTLHYAKLGMGYITDVLDRAAAAQEDGLEQEFVDALGSASPDDIPGMVASNGADGVKLLADTSPGAWSIGIDGICPAGRALCGVGGEKLSQHNNPYHAPVPGGPRNCPRCRFFITGPVFLNGQVVAFNNLVFAISEKAKDLDRLKKKTAQAEANGLRGRRLERERTGIDMLEIEINEMLKSLQARFILLERSRALLREGQGTGKHQMISLAGKDDWELILERTSDFDLIEFVAQACEVFPEKAEPSAPLRKGKILDRFLKANGYQALFYALPDDEALAAGNRMTRFLQERVGRDRLRSLMDGHATLSSLGIAAEFNAAAGRLIRTEQLSVDATPAGLLPATPAHRPWVS